MRLWDEMEALTGRDVGFRRTGILYLCESEADIARHEDWLARAGDYALDSRMISGETLANLLPGATRSFRAALHTASDGRAEPQKAAPAIAAAAAAAGAILVPNAPSRRLKPAAAASRRSRPSAAGSRRRTSSSRVAFGLPSFAAAGPSTAAARRPLLGPSHGAGQGRPGRRRLGAALRLSQASRRRLHHRQWQRQPARHRAGQLPLSPRFPSRAEARMAWHRASASARPSSTR